MRCWRVLAFGLAMTGAVSAHAGNCSFAKRPPFTVNHNGHCNFDFETLSYAGTAAEQAACLLTTVKRGGFLGDRRASLPPFFASHAGQNLELPEKVKLAALLRERGLDDIAASLDKPVSRGNDGDPKARPATYFVIHDTSTPNFGELPWPVDINADPKINNLKRYHCDNDIERAHVFINRQGAVLFSHDFSVPWRATKFETAANFGNRLRGLYLHIELIQPRRRAKEFRGRNDYEAPEPGFSRAQYEALALVYAAASLRAGFWMIPGFHSVIDEKIANKHDDPQNFRLEDFADALNRLRERLK